MEDRKRAQLVAGLAALSAALSFSAVAVSYFNGPNLELGLAGPGLFMTVIAVASLRRARSPKPPG